MRKDTRAPMLFPPDDHSCGRREFLAESEETLEDLCRDLALLSASLERGDVPPDLLNAIFRGVHTLKGQAGMLGYSAVSGLAHNMETLLDLTRLGKTPLDSQLVEVMGEALDTLGALIHASVHEEHPPDIHPLLERISGCCARTAPCLPRDTGRPILPGRITAYMSEFEKHRLNESVSKGRLLLLVHASYLLDSFDRELEDLVGLIKSWGEVICTLPIPGRERPDAIAFDILVATDNPPDIFPIGVTWETVAVEAPAVKPPCQDPVTQSGETTTSFRSMGGMVRVDIGALDELMALVGELVAAQNSLMAEVERVRTVASSEAKELVKTAGRMGKKLLELQDRAKEIRLVPVRTLYDKVTRVVRRIAADGGHDLELGLHGAETRLDKQIIDDLFDPLMHLVRNSVDHGIESPAERLSAGKSATGRITITASQKGNRVVIEVADDGRGIDLEKVRCQAVDRGLSNGADALTEQQALDLIFEPGFSTREVVSELSGRGVGLDVVKNNIRSLSGTVTVTSVPGRGSRFLITLPITLAIIRTLIIEVGAQTYGIPVSSIQETVAITGGEIVTHDRNEMLPVRDKTLPVVRLEHYFGSADHHLGGWDGYAVVAGAGSQRVGIMADGIRGQFDLVVKPLGELLSGIRGIAGAADIGDERTILILDPIGISDETYRGWSGRVS